MCFVYIQSINAKLLKRNHIILAGIILQFSKPRFQTFLCTFKLLDGKSFCIAGF